MTNTLVILSDEHQARAMGCAGHPFVSTPNLDRLAARGTRFTRAVTPSPICVPTRAAFATGQYVHQCGYWDNSFGYDGRVRGWGHALQEAGIAVESIGKLHYQSADLPAGFDVEHMPMHLHNGVGMLWASIRDPLPEHRPSNKRMLGEHIGPGNSPYTRYDQSITDLAVEWLQNKRQAKEPWCLYVGLVAPHFPLVAPQEFFDLYPLDRMPKPKLHPRDGHALHSWSQEHEDFWSHEATLKDENERRTAIAAYYGLVSWLDHNVGRILTALQEAGLTDTTRVIYASDHGDNLGTRGLWGKSNLYRESVDIPMIAAGPGFAQGRLCETPVSLLDLSVTILEGFGLDKDKVLPQAVGRSLREIVSEPADPTRLVFSEYHAVGSNSAAYMLQDGRWKYNHYVRHEPELFDLEHDPEETTNLARRPDHRDIVAKMERALRELCDPDQIDRQAKTDQAALIARHGGMQAAFELGRAVAGGTPAPDQRQSETAFSRSSS